MSKEKKIKSAREQALKDIAEYLKTETLLSTESSTERHIISTIQLNTKLNRYLNRMLGLHKVNKNKK